MTLIAVVLLVLADNSVHDTNVTVTLISTLGLIVLAVIGVWQVRVTGKAKTDANSAKEEAQSNAAEAATSAQMARDYAAAMGIKDALVASLEARVDQLERQNTRLMERLDDFERRDEEHNEQQRAAAVLERNYAFEIDRLQEEIDKLKRRR